MLPNAAFIIYLSFSPPLLMERGTPAALAALMTALASWISIASIPAGGVLTDRSGRIHTFIVAGLLGSALLTALHALSDAPWLLITLYGVSVGAWPGAIMSLPGRVLGPASRSTGFGVFYTTYYMGMVLLVPVGGWLQDATGTARAPLLLSAALMLAGVVALAALRLLLRRGAPAPAPEAA
jgi:MFS family permease